MRNALFALIVAAAWAGVPAVLDACGDKFLLVGRGLSFGRVYASVYPGSIVIFAGSRTSPQQQKLAQYMKRAGHRVNIVADEGALSETLTLGQTDIVIVDVTMKAAVDTRVGTVAQRPTVLYLVSERDKLPTTAVQQDPPVVIKANDKVNRFLAHIEAAMKSRAQTGLRVKRG